MVGKRTRVNIWHCLAALLCVGPSLASAADFVTQEDFQKFVADFEKFKTENAALKVQNEQLRKSVDELQLKAKPAELAEKPNKALTPDPGGRDCSEDLDALRSGTTKFLISGYMDSGFTNRHGENSTFDAAFHPVFLWKLDERISVETDFDYAVMNYHIDDLLTLEAGRFLTPLATFHRRQRPSWINKLPDMPLAFDETTGLVPRTSVGAMLAGAFDAGPTQFNWNAYVANGPTLNTFSPTRFGALEFSGSEDNNNNKTLGGRLGFLPIPDVEIGGSIMGGRVGQHRTPQVNVRALLAAADLSFVRDFDRLKGTVDIKAEWVWSTVDDAVYQIGGKGVPFDNNRRNGGYVRLAYRPTKVQQKWVRNLEVALRFDRLDNPEFAALTPKDARSEWMDHDRFTAGLDYWLAASTVLKFAYEHDSQNGGAVLVQFAVGF
jgi:hypothetical protein